MKEKFEDRRLTGAINVTCKFEDGTTRMWETTKQEVVQHIVDIVRQYTLLNLRLTLRQLHYQLVKSNWIVNHQSAYKKLGDILDDCRYGGVIDWDAIEDRGRVPDLPYYVEDIADALEDTVRHYRLDRQANQQTVVEVWTEKDALSGILQRITHKYHIRLSVNKGYTSSSAIYRAYKRIEDYINDGKQVVILYFGDHDPSGLDMVRDIEERLHFMLKNGHSEVENPEDNLQVIQMGLTMAQIRQYNLPPNPAKMTDSRAEEYIKKFGKTCWEVDALDPETLMEIVESFIRHHIDTDVYEEQIEKEKEDKAKLISFIAKN